MKICCVVPEFPTLSETFIQRELVELAEKSDVDLKVFSFDSDESLENPISADVEYFPTGRFQQILLAVLFFLSNPFVCLRKIFERESKMRHVVQAMYMAQCIKAAAPDLIYHHYLHLTAPAALIAGQLLDCPVVLASHARDIFMSSDQALKNRINQAAGIVNETEYNLQYLQKFAREHGLDESRLVHVYNCLDPEVFSGLEPDRGGDPPLLLTVCRLIPKKGIPTMLKAYKILADSNVNFQARVIGGNPLDIDYKQQSRDLGLTSRVEFTGPLPFPRVKKEFMQADIFVLASQLGREGDRDGLPTVLMEASLARLPVVTTTVSGLPEGVRDGETGYLVEPGSPEQLAEALKKLINNPVRREEFGKNGNQFVRSKFNCADRIDELTEKLSEFSRSSS